MVRFALVFKSIAILTSVLMYLMYTLCVFDHSSACNAAVSLLVATPRLKVLGIKKDLFAVFDTFPDFGATVNQSPPAEAPAREFGDCKSFESSDKST